MFQSAAATAAHAAAAPSQPQPFPTAVEVPWMLWINMGRQFLTLREAYAMRLVSKAWLQHTDVDIPHYAKDTWVWAKGAFSTVDRPYGAILDFLHHRIGSTHVAHHVSHEIPHYNAVKATEALKETYPKLYLYDPTNIWVALWRVCTKCTAVERRTDSKMVEKDMYVFVN